MHTATDTVDPFNNHNNINYHVARSVICAPPINGKYTQYTCTLDLLKDDLKLFAASKLSDSVADFLIW